MKRVLVVALLALVPILAGGCGGSRRCPSGGTEAVFRAVPAGGGRVTPAGMQIARQIMESRVANLGVSSPSVTVHGDEIVIDFAGAPHLAAVAKVIGTPGELQIFDFETSLAPPSVTRNQQPSPLPSLYALLTAVKKEAGKGSPESYYLFKATTSHQILQGPAPTLQQLFLPYKDGKQPPGTQVLKVPTNREPVFARNGASKSGESWYLFKYTPARPDGPPQLTGKDLVQSGITADVDANTGAPIVTLQFTKHGSKEFQDITRAEYDRGRINAGQAGQLGTQNQSTNATYAGHNAIVLDGRLDETPYIDYTDAALSDGIAGNAQITEPSAKAAKDTALVLQSGSLPYSFQQVKLTSCPR